MARTASKVSKKNAEIVLNLVAEWLGTQGYGDKNGGPAPTGRDAAYRGAGPELRMDFDFLGLGETPTVVLEGGPYEWSMECSWWVQQRLDERGVPVWVEPYTSWALSVYDY